MEELRQLERRITLVENRQENLEDKQERINEKQERFVEALAVLKNDLNETEKRIHEKLDEMRSNNQVALGRLEEHLTEQDNHLFELSNQVGESTGRLNWPPSAKIMIGGLVSVLTALIAAIIKLLKDG